MNGDMEAGTTKHRRFSYPNYNKLAVQRKPEARLLVIYTGGTIGMIRLPNGALGPAPNKFASSIRASQDMHDQEYAKKNFEPDSPLLVLPESDERQQVIYFIKEYEPLLDSSNMTLADWERIAKDIHDEYEAYDAFVILHGTDTLAYTASALSFMLENLGKTVVITGAQISMFGTRSDGRDNFICALTIAANYDIPEVTVFFRNKLFRGNRTIKVSTSSFNAFDSPNCPPLAKVGIHIDVNEKVIFRPYGIQKFGIHTNFNKNVGLLRLHPNMNLSTVKAFLQAPIQGVVFQTYGAGNMPSNRDDLLKELKRATTAGVLIVNITQCTEGHVEEIYDTGKMLTDIGVVLGGDMTPEAAFAKLSYVLSKTEWNLEIRKEMMRKNLRGELTVIQRTYQEPELAETVAQVIGASTPREVSELRSCLYPALLNRAVLNGDLMSLSMLRAKDCDLSSPNSDCRTPLHVACAEGQTECVQYLLEYGANVHLKDRFNRTPLADAIQYGHLDIVDLLVKGGAHLNPDTRNLGDSLCLAAAVGDIAQLKGYQMAGVNLDTPDTSGRTPLYVATLNNQDEAVALLMESGCRPNTEDKIGVCAVHVARKMGYEKILKLLDRKRRSVQPKDAKDSKTVKDLDATIAEIKADVQKGSPEKL